MSPRAASRLESLGFREVYDYAAGKADWFAVGLPMEGEAASRPVIGRLARSDVPSAGLDERLGDVSKRAEAAGWDQAVVLDDRGVLLGWLGAEALGGDPAAPAAAAMREGPVTFRPNEGIEETASWMDARSAAGILVTSSDGTFMGVVRREDLGVTEPAPAEEGWDADVPQDRCGRRLPKIVNPDARRPSSVESDLPRVGDGAGLRWITIAVRKDELALGPQPLLLQRRHRDLRQLDTAPAGDRFQLDEDQATAALALKCSLHLESTGDQVHIAPHEPYGLTDP